VKLISPFFLVISLYSCNNATLNNTHEGDSVGKKNIDSNLSSIHTSLSDTTKIDGDQELRDMFNEYVARYKKRYTIDSGFVFGVDTFHLQLTHYCLNDSAIKVPRQYVYMYKLDNFVTHNFATTLRLDKNNRIIVQKTVTKEDFGKLIDKDLRELGTLRYPSMRLENDSIGLDYSISIPLTDVGIGVTMMIDRDGGISYRNH